MIFKNLRRDIGIFWMALLVHWAANPRPPPMHNVVKPIITTTTQTKLFVITKRKIPSLIVIFCCRPCCVCCCRCFIVVLGDVKSSRNESNESIVSLYSDWLAWFTRLKGSLPFQLHTGRRARTSIQNKLSIFTNIFLAWKNKTNIGNIVDMGYL